MFYSKTIGISFDVGKILKDGLLGFFKYFFQDITTEFATIFADVMSGAINIIQLPLVQNGIKYTQGLAVILLVIKSLQEGFKTYILMTSGDSESDPMGLVIRSIEALAIILSIPWIVTEIFMFGTKLSHDVAALGTGSATFADWGVVLGSILLSAGGIIILVGIVILVMLLIIAFQATIRGAELALCVVLGSIMALNLTSNNRSVWSSWIKQVIIICTTQSIQIFMLQGAMSLMTSGVISSSGYLLIIGWLWVTIKTPKYLQQFLYSTGVGGSIGAGAKQTGSMVIMRKMMTK